MRTGEMKRKGEATGSEGNLRNGSEKVREGEIPRKGNRMFMASTP